ncbi:MAG: hypothetical protein KGH60_02685 [Candidatus Micrarchaeota archaeon]|nr:hypothetical protein [Candidatus Micrarchaeota archaeon]
MVTVNSIYKQSFESSWVKSLRIYRDKGDADVKIPQNETTIFRSKGKQLVFIAGLHINERTPFVDFIETVIKYAKPQAVLLEQPSNLSKESLERNKNSRKSEVQYAILLAEKHGAEIKPMDLSLKEEFTPYLRHADKDAIKAGILISLMRHYTGLKKYYGKELSTFKDQDFYDQAIMEFIRNIFMGWNGNFKKAFVDLSENYKGSLLDRVKKIDQEAIKKYIGPGLTFESAVDIQNIQAPYPWGKYELNKIVSWHNAWRNKSMIDTCIKNLKKHRSVVALAGSGHIQECRDFITTEMKKEFGSVEVRRWKELGSGKM